MPHPKRTSRKPKENKTEAEMVDLLDRLSEFKEFEQQILPALRKDLASGMTAEEIAKKYVAHAMTRTISIALTEPDSGKALAASKEIVDRAEGKAAQKIETTHRYEKLKEEELDSLLLSKLEEQSSSNPKKVQ